MKFNGILFIKLKIQDIVYFKMCSIFVKKSPDKLSKPLIAPIEKKFEYCIYGHNEVVSPVANSRQ